MHLIRTDGSFKLVSVDATRLWSDPDKPYAILSHTWARNNDHEVSFRDMQNIAEARRKPGWEKIEKSCEKAKRDNFAYIWIDTCCIDKTKPHDTIQSEINSMYQYYENAEVCYVLLSDMPGSCPQLLNREILKQVFPKSKWTWREHILRSRWFTRGWTLQELIAPRRVAFYNRRWGWIGSLRGDLKAAIGEATQIPASALKKEPGWSLERYTIAERMSWASTRNTTKQEDMAYCLLGIFNIQMATIPGEGTRAFERLQLQILGRSVDHSILAWNWQAAFKGSLGGNTSLLAPHPRFFLAHSPVVPRRETREENARYEHSYEMTNRGLEIRLPIISDSSKPQGSKHRLALLNCCFLDSKGEKQRIALPVKELDDGKSRGMTPIYEVCFEARGKPNAKGEKEYTRLIQVSQNPEKGSLVKAEQTIILLSGFI